MTARLRHGALALCLAHGACVVPEHRFAVPDDAVVPPTTHALLDWTGDLTGARFFDAPFPTLLRTVDGRLDWTGLPAVPVTLELDAALAVARTRSGTPLAPVLYVRWSAPLAPLRPEDTGPGGLDAVYLLDVDPQSPEHGRRFPVIGQTLAADPMVPADVLALTVAPGVTLRPSTTYGVMITTDLDDADGRQVLPDPELSAWRDGGLALSAAGQMLAPLWPLVQPPFPLAGPAAALVFRTGDPVSDARTRLDAAVVMAPVSIDPATLTLVTDPAFDSPDLCEVHGAVSLPQFQVGTPPFAVGGAIGATPEVQRAELVAFTITVPRMAMPTTGYPLVLTVPELGDLATSAVAPVTIDGTAPDAQGRRWGTGLAFPLARAGLATASAARPQGPERLPADVQRRPLRADNPGVIGGNVQQAAIEVRLLASALAGLAIPEATLTGCLDPALLGGAPAVVFDAGHVGVHGQGHGAAAATLAVATDPALAALTLTGARGGWTALAVEPGPEGARAALAAALAAPEATLTRLHPALAILEGALEDTDPLVLASTLAARATSSAPPRPVLNVIVAEDAAVPIADAAALARALQVPLAGPVAVPVLDELIRIGGILAAALPVTATTPGGALAPAATVVAPPPVAPSLAHDAAYHQRGLRYQLTCFARTALGSPGTAAGARIVAPVDRDDAFPCD